MKKVVAVPTGGLQMQMMFAEDEHLFAKPSEVIPLCAGKYVSMDVETTGLEWWRDSIIGLGLWCPEAGVAHYIVTDTEQLRQEVKSGMQQLARNPETTLLAHNLKFDANFLGIELWQVPCKIADTAVMAHLYDSRLQKNLKALERTFLGTETKKQQLGTYTGARIKEMPLAVVAEYCINDARVTMEVAETLKPKLTELKLGRLFHKDMQYMRLLQKVERRGMLLDKEYGARAIARFKANLIGMEQELFGKIRVLAQAKGLPDPLTPTFNWRSDEQLSAVIYAGCGIPMPINPFLSADGIDHTKFATRGKYNKTATSSFLLMEKANHPLGNLILDMRETDKLRVTVEKWMAMADDRSMLHTSFNLTGTRTGRLSSSDPNLQNVAGAERTRETQSVWSGGVIREEEYNLRSGITARPGYVFVSTDWKQQEARLFAILCKDPVMLEAVKHREDVHGLVARMVWAADIERDPSCFKVRREWAKTLSFGMLYGMTKGSLQHRLNKTQDESDAIMQQYQGRFTRIMPFLHETVQLCKRTHLLRYWSGRIWREEEEQSMYKGVNAMVQGGGADLLSVAAMRVDKYLDSLGPDVGSIASFIHDEILAEVRIARAREVAKEVARIMEVEDLLGIPFLTDSKLGFTYGKFMSLPEWDEYMAAQGQGTVLELQGAIA